MNVEQMIEALTWDKKARKEVETNWKELYEAEKKRAEGLEMDLIYYKNRYEVLQGEVNAYKNSLEQRWLVDQQFAKASLKRRNVEKDFLVGDDK